MNQLQDEDYMPFGKYGPKPKGEGLRLSEIPASYFHYLWSQGLRHDKQSRVADYIRRNLDSLRQEHPDGIW